MLLAVFQIVVVRTVGSVVKVAEEGPVRSLVVEGKRKRIDRRDCRLHSRAEEVLFLNCLTAGRHLDTGEEDTGEEDAGDEKRSARLA